MVPFLGKIFDKEAILFVSEIVPGGPLDAFLAGVAHKKVQLETRKRLELGLQIASALQHFHKHGIIYGEICSRLCLVRWFWAVRDEV